MKNFSFILVMLINTFSGRCQTFHKDIILVNVQNFDNEPISKCIAVLNKLHVKSIAIDLALTEFSGSPEDRALFTALSQANKLILPRVIESDGIDSHGREMIYVSPAGSKLYYGPPAVAGFVSALRTNFEELTIPEQFQLWQENYHHGVFYHFSFLAAKSLDSAKAQMFFKKHKQFVDVDYGAEKRVFRTLTVDEVLSHTLTEADVKGKLVMLGVLGPSELDQFKPAANDPYDRGKIYGLEYLANIVAQILE